MKSSQIAIAALVAILLQPVVGFVTFFRPLFGVALSFEAAAFYILAVFTVALLSVCLLGVPCFLFLQKTQRIGFLSLSLWGLCLGMLPYLLVAMPRFLDGYTAKSSWHGFTLDYYEQGKPMLAAWLNYGETALGFGLHGLVCSMVFYSYWRWYSSKADSA